MRQSAAYSSNEDHWDDDEHNGDDSQSIEMVNVDTDCNEGRQTSFFSILSHFVINQQILRQQYWLSL